MYGPTTKMYMHKYIICVVVVSVFFYISFFNVPNWTYGGGGGGKKIISHHQWSVINAFSMSILITQYTRPSQQKNNGQCNRRPRSVQQAWAKRHQHKYTSTQNHNHLVVHINYVPAVSCDYWFWHVLQSYTPPPPTSFLFYQFLPSSLPHILMPILPPPTPNLPSILLPKQQQEQKKGLRVSWQQHRLLFQWLGHRGKQQISITANTWETSKMLIA